MSLPHSHARVRTYIHILVLFTRVLALQFRADSLTTRREIGGKIDAMSSRMDGLFAVVNEHGVRLAQHDATLTHLAVDASGPAMGAILVQALGRVEKAVEKVRVCTFCWCSCFACRLV